jgi:hypothetical protein
MRPEEWAPALGRLERLELPEEGGEWLSDGDEG